jgi:phosphoglycolate phosphatase-like HAD superfamily hydrolase
MTQHFLPNTQIELVRPIERGRLKHAILDFDGTVSLLREGWQKVMAPVMMEAICGSAPVTPEIEKKVWDTIEETTGINTILQMEHLVEMVRAHGFVSEGEVLDAYGYKAIYNERLMKNVNERITRFSKGELPLVDVIVRGSLDFVKALHDRGLTLYLASGTDHDDVTNEAGLVGAAQYFKGGIYGALRTFAESNKDKVIKEIIAKNDLHGSEVIVCGDGPVEIQNAKSNGCIALGIASDEVRGFGWDMHKRNKLVGCGADLMVPDFTEWETLIDYLFSKD